ncbi:MAG: hypothetical protein Q7S74_05345 [Nanoarchaeota archaeon]|nr:hypothetical protein [Nanoarchaeota archaeon]
MGLTLRKLEVNINKKHNLREKIFSKYGTAGLHIAQFVENGILNRYIGILIGDITSIDDFKNKIEIVLKSIDKHVLFVKGNDSPRFILRSTMSIVAANSPSIFIISGIFPASKIVRNCESGLNEIMKNYELEKISDGKKEILFYKLQPSFDD